MILDRYLARRFAVTLLMTVAGFFGLLLFIDLIEQVRRVGDEAGGFGAALALALLNVPQVLYGILPIVVVLAALAMFMGLARSSELVVTRGSGRSGLRALLGPSVVALLFGAAAVAGLNPIVAATSRAFEAKQDRIGGASALALSDDGLWLRQGDADGQTVIRAARSNLDGTELRGVTFLTFDAQGRPLERVEARAAALGPGAWTLSDAKSWPLADPNPEAAASVAATRTLPSSLTAAQIRDSFGEPSSIPIWELPRFIRRLEAAGFAARRHEVHLQMELAQPLLLLSMTLVAAAFAMRPQRGRRTGLLVLGAALAGFAALALRNLSEVLGDAGQIPPALAAWAPPTVVILSALALLLHLEEG